MTPIKHRRGNGAVKIRDLLNSKEFKYRDVVTVKPEDTVFQAILILVEHNMGALPVCTQEGNLVGIITERDIVRKCLTNSSGLELIAANQMPPSINHARIGEAILLGRESLGIVIQKCQFLFLVCRDLGLHW